VTTVPDYESFKVRRSRRLKALRQAGEYWLVRAVLALARRMSVPGLQRLGRVLGTLLPVVNPQQRAICTYQIGLALPELTRSERHRLARRCFRQLGMTACEAMALPRLRRQGERWVYLEAEQVLREAHARGRGAILVTAHTGNWELLPVALARLGLKALAIVRTLNNPRVNGLVRDLQRCPELEIAERGSPAAARQMLNCLKNGDLLVMATDQDIDAQGVFVSFFGIPAHTPRAPASLALKLEAPVVAYFDLRRPDGTHLLRFEEIPLTAAIRQAADPVQAYTQAISDVMEAHIRAHPEQWAWNHRRWKRRPPGEGSSPAAGSAGPIRR
jgi:KDO2-lipid IV(A) lauroyltransferase